MLMTEFQLEYNQKLKKSLSKVSSKYKQIMIQTNQLCYKKLKAYTFIDERSFVDLLVKYNFPILKDPELEASLANQGCVTWDQQVGTVQVSWL